MANSDYITMEDVHLARQAVQALREVEGKMGVAYSAHAVSCPSPLAFQELQQLTGCKPVNVGRSQGETGRTFQQSYVDVDGVKFWHTVEVS